MREVVIPATFRFQLEEGETEEQVRELLRNYITHWKQEWEEDRVFTCQMPVLEAAEVKESSKG